MAEVPLPAPQPSDADGGVQLAPAKGKPVVPVAVPAAQQELILQHAWHLKKKGYRESTITGRVKIGRAVVQED